MKHITAEALTKEQYSCYNVWSGSPDNCVDGWELKMTNTASPAATREEAEVIPPKRLYQLCESQSQRGEGGCRRDAGQTAAAAALITTAQSIPSLC